MTASQSCFCKTLYIEARLSTTKCASNILKRRLAEMLVIYLALVQQKVKTGKKIHSNFLQN